jgi:hypothetical protein
MKERIQIQEYSFRQYLDQFSGIRNLAMDWYGWHLFILNSSIPWLRHFPSLRVFTVVVDVYEPNTLEKVVAPRKDLRFVPVAPNTVRAESEKIILSWLRKCLENFHLKYPENIIPEVEVVSVYVAGDDCSSKADLDFKAHLEFLLDRNSRFTNR